MTSMQDFLNLSLERQVVGITIELVLMGLVLGMIGAYGAAERREARQALADEHIARRAGSGGR